MVTHFGKYRRTLLAGFLVFGGAAAVSVIGGSLAASPAGAASPPAWTAYVVSYNDDAVIPVNTATHAVGSPITVGSGPSAIAITPDGSTGYVTEEGTTNTSPGFVTPIDLSTNTPGAPISVGSGPDAIAITPNGLTAYVGNYNDDTVTPVNLVTNAAGKAIPVGGAPTSIAITPDGTTAYVGRAFESGIQLDLTTNSTQPGASPSGFASAITPDGTTVIATNPRDNNVDVVNPATDTGTTVAALNDPEGVAITPDGSTAYVAYSPFTTNKGALLPIPVADPNAPGTPINLGTNSAYAVAVTPDGSTAFVTDLTGGNLVPVNLSSDTAGAPIPLGSEGTNPIAIAITPDQAPIAHMHVTALGNSTMSFNASASTVAYGTIASYAWNFGDGSTETTTTPTVTHTYTNTAPNQVATVTETDSTGTSTTGQVYTGQTASRNGSSQATGKATIYLNPSDTAVEYPTVSAVTPAIGPTFSPSTVTVTGTSFWPGQTEVYVGGVAATNVTVNADETSLTATLPAQSAGIYDITVTSATNQGQEYYFGSSATTPADQFTYSASIPPVSVSCTSATCTIPPVQYGSATVSAAVSPDCTSCTLTASLGEGVPATSSAVDSCPDAMSYDQAQADINENEASSSGSALSADFVNTFQELGDFFSNPTVCVDVDAVSDGPARTPASRQDESPTPAVGQDFLVKKCHKKAVAPCVQSVVVNGNSVGTTVLLPVNESITLTVGPQKERSRSLRPRRVRHPDPT